LALCLLIGLIAELIIQSVPKSTFLTDNPRNFLTGPYFAFISENISEKYEIDKLNKGKFTPFLSKQILRSFSFVQIFVISLIRLQFHHLTKISLV
jgi:hypothetical protein